MAIDHKFTLLCDEVRQEITGKFIVIGMYTPDVTVPMLPFVLPSLSFLNWLETDTAGPWDISFQLSHEGNVLAGGSGRITIGQPGVVALPIRLGPIQFQSTGKYTFSLQIIGRPEPATLNFKVILNAPQPATPTPAPHGVH